MNNKILMVFLFLASLTVTALAGGPNFNSTTAKPYRVGGTTISIADGGTGASTSSQARTNLGLGSIATQSASSVNITGGSIDILHQNFFIHDNVDTTKKLRTDVSRISPNTTRAVIFPDADGNVDLDNYITTATDYTVLKSDKFVEITNTTAARTMTLPSAGTLHPGKHFIFIDGSNGAATNNIVIKNSGGTTIATINTNGGSARVVTDLTFWRSF